MAQSIVLITCVVLPLILAYFLYRKYQASWWMLGLGMLSFTCSQLVLRLPLLSYLQSNAKFYVFMMDTIPYLLFLAITAALFEESGRWICFRLDTSHHRLVNAFQFGIGHGMIEAIVLVMLPMLSRQPSMSQAMLASIERLFAMSFHICASLWVYQSIVKRKFGYLGFAYLAHFLFNFIPISLSILVPVLGSNALYIEGIIMMFAVGMILITKCVILKKERL